MGEWSDDYTEDQLVDLYDKFGPYLTPDGRAHGSGWWVMMVFRAEHWPREIGIALICAAVAFLAHASEGVHCDDVPGPDGLDYWKCHWEGLR